MMPHHYHHSHSRHQHRSVHQQQQQQNSPQHESQQQQQQPLINDSLPPLPLSTSSSSSSPPPPPLPLHQSGSSLLSSIPGVLPLSLPPPLLPPPPPSPPPPQASSSSQPSTSFSLYSSSSYPGASGGGSGGGSNWEYIPPNVLESIVSYTNSLQTLLQCMLVCKKWYYILADDRCDIWRMFAQRKLSKGILKSPILSNLVSFRAKLRAHYFAWDSNECSRNIYIKPNGFTLHRNPVAQSTDAAKGKLGFITGRHCWEVCWDGPLGTVAVVGIATKEATVQCQGYVALIGSNANSWGWNLVENHLVHNGHCVGNYPRLNNAPRYQTGDRLRIILDCDSQTLAFERDYEFLGIAFYSLPRKLLYPAVSAVYGNTEISMVYLGYPLDG